MPVKLTIVILITSYTTTVLGGNFDGNYLYGKSMHTALRQILQIWRTSVEVERQALLLLLHSYQTSQKNINGRTWISLQAHGQVEQKKVDLVDRSLYWLN